LNKKVKSSLSLQIFLGILIVLIVTSTLIYGSLRLFMPQAFASEQSKQFAYNLQSLVSELEKIPKEEMSALITAFSVNNQSNAALFDSEQNELVNINYESDNFDNTANDASTTIVFLNAEKTYSINANFPSHTVDQLTSTFQKIFPLVASIVLVLSILTAFFYSQMLAKPIVNISNTSKKMTTLDLTWRCDIERSDEIGILAENLNIMAAKLAQTFDELNSVNTKLQDDILKERQREKQRVDFFKAVSHELKTPITILKGELEGMIYAVGEYKDRDTYLRHSMKTINEMERMVKEILSASQVAADDLSLSFSKIDICETVKDSCKKLQGIVEDKQINLTIKAESFTYYGDIIMLQKAILNIIGNAITHSSIGATITVFLQKGILRVENTGVHIEQEDMEQIFQPFYQADKSRSNNNGGSGLGLYITKTVFERHGLKHKIENTRKGVMFSVFFKQ
jgi:Signal transduction histidine kinase